MGEKEYSNTFAILSLTDATNCYYWEVSPIVARFVCLLTNQILHVLMTVLIKVDIIGSQD